LLTKNGLGSLAQRFFTELFYQKLPPLALHKGLGYFFSNPRKHLQVVAPLE